MEEEKKEKKKSVLEEFRKKYGKHSFKSIYDDEPLEVVSSGILSLDYVSGVGGLPKGMNTVLEGLPSSGKTEIALDCAKFFQDLDPNNRVCFVDVENRLKIDRIHSRNLDPHRFDIVRCAIAERVFDMLCDLVIANEHGMIITDSLAVLVPASDFEQEIEGNNKPGTQAKSINNGFKKLGACMMEQNSKVINIFINQMMGVIGAKAWEPKTAAKSGFGPKYLSSFTVQVEQLMGKERVDKAGDGSRLGNDVKLTVQKNSLCKFQNRKAIFRLNYDTGPVLSSELFNLGLGYGIIVDNGRGNYVLNLDAPKSYKTEALMNALSDPVIQPQVRKLIETKIKNGDMTVDSEPLVEE